MTSRLPPKKALLDEYYQTHFVKDGQWINNLTDEPCDKNPLTNPLFCNVCKRMIGSGLQPMDPESYNTYFH